MTRPLDTLPRRRFLVATSLTLGALALRGYPIHAAASAHFTHGVASGDPLHDRVILWTRVLPGSGFAQAITVQWEVAVDEDFTQIVAQGQSRTGHERDYTVKVDAVGLLAGSLYFYRFIAQGEHSAVGHTRTLPAVGVEALQLAVLSCSNFPQGYFNVYRAVAERDYDVVVHLGDYIYEYALGGYANPLMEGKGREVQPEHEIVSLEDYRMRYGLYRSDADLQAVHQAHPFICVWDDHEIANNTWQTGAQNHNAGEGEFAARRRAAIQAFYEWLPIRESSSVEEGIIYRSFNFGDLASLIMLDTRLVGRDEQLSHDMGIDTLRSELAKDTRSIMGREQEQWFDAELRKSKELGIPWQLIGQQLLMGKLFPPQFADEEFDPAQREQILGGRYGQLRTRGRQGLPLNLDAWAGYPANRERVLNSIRANANNAVVLAGDSHSSWAFDLKDEAGHAVAVEFATPSVTSPGFENFLPLPDLQIEEATLAASPELKYMKANGRGWIDLHISASKTVATWQFVSTILETEFTVSSGAVLETYAGQHYIES
jgi:alkaline phosphatase D